MSFGRSFKSELLSELIVRSRRATPCEEFESMAGAGRSILRQRVSSCGKGMSSSRSAAAAWCPYAQT